ncbi:MAG: starch-binding protein, partial [Ruminococcus sp.]|nr:starch-binding protein [Ruminococcus sp.]
LKSIGVDGFRFDAAKHIGLPSEGDGFWAKIAGIGIYRYGEILDSPGGDANKVMNEYAQYIGVTDSDYSGAITGAIRDGKVVENNGNWVNRGISADKIVYWGESHDTYSNDPPPKEGGWTKYLDQNIIDRAYAVVGAKANSQSLYLSRPFNKDKTSIMSGQKGSTHFTSAEVAAVNHFHNAMVGTKEYYTTGNNCFVVCREGGAVIVAASGSNFDVTVPNGGSIVKQGTYTDEVSGSTWTVTGSNISGKIGTSGIAVIYSSKPAGPSASVTPGSSKYKTDSLTLTLSYENATSGSYSIDGGAYQNFTKGQTITIGAGKPVGTKTTVSVKASDGTNTSDPETYTYTKSDNSAQMVYFDNSSYNWSSVYAYIYGNKTEVAAWPGTQMQKDSTGYFALEIPEGFEEGNIIFTESKDAVDHRYPADKDPGLPLEGTTKIFKANHQFVDYDPPVPTTPVPTTAAPTTAPVGKILIGDTNGDSKITVSDATLIQMHAAGMQKLTGDRLTAADTNKDGSVNVGDATMVQLYLVYDKSSSNYTGT